MFSCARGGERYRLSKSRHRCLFARKVQIVVVFDTRKIVLTDKYRNQLPQLFTCSWCSYIFDKLDLIMKPRDVRGGVVSSELVCRGSGDFAPVSHSLLLKKSSKQAPLYSYIHTHILSPYSIFLTTSSNTDRHPMATTCQDSLADTSSKEGSEEESRSDESGSDSDEDYSSDDDEDDSTDSTRGSGEETEGDHEVGRSILSPMLAFGALRPHVGSGCEAPISLLCMGGWGDCV